MNNIKALLLMAPLTIITLALAGFMFYHEPWFVGSILVLGISIPMFAAGLDWFIEGPVNEPISPAIERAEPGEGEE